ncbi:MAG: WG repeat-containing protein [Cyclobacteriaceae bacterium]|nr:WG repeat-containing protein [Cyclobacteriaceae bacterium]
MKKIIGYTLLIVGIVAACSIVRKEKLDKDAEQFLADFKNVLTKSDAEILAMFFSGQTEEEILSGITVLQNKDTTVSTSIRYAEATAKWEDGYLLIDVPVQIDAKGEEMVVKHLTLKLIQKKARKFYINRFGGEEVYTAYQSLKYQVENRDLLAKRLQALKVFYDRAMELQKNFDSVVWYTQFKDTTYYFAVNGTFVLDSLNGKSPTTFKMGLVHENGKIVVPVEYDLIGNPSINIPDAVEVKRDGKVGYFDLTGKMLVPAEYTWVVPYEDGESKALVKKDTVFGWLDASYQFHENFPSEKAEKYIREFTYLTEKKFVFGGDHQQLIVNLAQNERYNYESRGIIVAPGFLVNNNIFDWVQTDFITLKPNEDKIFSFGNAYKENSNQFSFNLSESFDLLLNSIETRYIGGRGEFYTTSKINVVDKNQRFISSVDVWGNEGFTFKRVNENLYQASYLAYYEEGPSPTFKEINLPAYSFFKFENSKLERVASSRLFGFTKYVKMDSSYITGNFKTYDYSLPENQREGTSTMLSRETLEYMRIEILASYGYLITNEVYLENFQMAGNLDDQKYYPKTLDYQTHYTRASEIDKYNLDFLAKILGPIAKPI